MLANSNAVHDRPLKKESDVAPLNGTSCATRRQIGEHVGHRRRARQSVRVLPRRRPTSFTCHAYKRVSTMRAKGRRLAGQNN
jgi:hypothetical protein